MEGFLSKVKAEVKAGVAKVESMSTESLESGVMGNLSKAMEKIEAGAMGAAGKAGMPATPGKGAKLTLDTLTRDELHAKTMRGLAKREASSARKSKANAAKRR